MAFERIRKRVGCVNGIVLCASLWGIAVVRGKLYGFCNTFAACQRDVAPVASVVLGCWVKVPRAGALAIP